MSLINPKNKCYGAIIQDSVEDSAWSIWHSLEDIVSEYPGENIYELTPKLLGRFQMKPVLVKVKKEKKKENGNKK